MSLRPAISTARMRVGMLLLALTVGTVHADRLHLVGGGIVEVDAWWVEDDSLIYRNREGTIGLPRALILKIEPTDGSGAPLPDAAEPSGPSAIVAGGPTREADAPRRVSREFAAQLREAATALQARDYAEAASHYQALMEQADRGFQEPRVGYALSQIALGEDDMALSVVLDGLAHDPRHPALLELLGDLRNREERVADALHCWKDAFRQDPNDRLRDKILKAERELHAGRDYSLDLSSHFNLRYDGEVDLDLAAAVTEFLEEQYWEMADRLDHAPRQPITVILYPTRQFRDVTQTPEWVGGLYDGKIRLPLGGLSRLNPVAEGLLRHELTHAFIHAKSRGQCPRWLHEGLAQRFEGRTLTAGDRQTLARRLSEVKPEQWESGGFSYPLALSLTLYLEERGGFDRLVRVLERLSEGDEPDSALEDTYEASYADLCRDWAAAVIEREAR